MAVPQITDYKLIIPTEEDFKKLLTAKLSYEAAQKTPNRDIWNKAHFNETPWGISYNVSIGKYNKQVASYNKVQRKGKVPVQKHDIALKYFIAAIAIDWQELIVQLKRTLLNWGYDSASLKNIATQVWLAPGVAEDIANACDKVSVTELIEKVEEPSVEALTESVITEAIEKHDSLNNKLFTKDEVLKDKVRDKMLEIVDEFLSDLKEQDVKIKVDDILFIGSNASYNYTKNSDIDLHIIANTKATKYPEELANALYSAYRSIFNKNLDIALYDIPLELFVETEASNRVSNGVYSVKKNKWVKKPVQEDIPDYDKEALDKLVSEWEDKCKKLIDEIKADKLEDEKKVVKILEDIYDKLRKKGVAEGEYSIKNLAFKELRNKGYLDQLKDYRNDLISKRLSLEERLEGRKRAEIYNQIARTAGTPPVIQDNGLFFIYNLKASEITAKVQALRQLPCVAEVQANESGKYDFSDTLAIAMNRMPNKYYNIRGRINI